MKTVILTVVMLLVIVTVGFAGENELIWRSNKDNLVSSWSARIGVRCALEQIEKAVDIDIDKDDPAGLIEDCIKKEFKSIGLTYKSKKEMSLLYETCKGKKCKIIIIPQEEVTNDR